MSKATSNQLALYNPSMNAQASQAQKFSPYNAPNPYQPQPQHAMMKQPLVYSHNHPFGATITTSMAAQPASSSIDQTTANNMQMVMLESKQVRLMNISPIYSVDFDAMRKFLLQIRYIFSVGTSVIEGSQLKQSTREGSRIALFEAKTAIN